MKLEQMDLNDILGFVRVVDAASFSEAARRMGVPKSLLSRRVARLESAIGVQLLRRTSRHFSLTEVGREVHERATRSFAMLSEAANAASAASDAPRGTVRMGAPPGVGSELLPGLIASFVARYPEVHVVVELLPPDVDLTTAGLDLALRPGPLKDSSLHRRKLQEMEFRMFAAPAYFAGQRAPRTIKELADHRFVLFATRRPKVRWTLHGPRGPVVVQARGGLASNDISFVRRAALAGAGIALLPDIVGERLVRVGALQRVLPEYCCPQNPLYLVYPAQPQLPPRVAALRDHLLEHFGPHTGATQLE